MKRLHSIFLTAALVTAFVCSFAFTAAAETEEIIVNTRAMWQTDWSPDGKYIAYGAFLASIYVVELETGEIKNITEHLPNFVTEHMKTYNMDFENMAQGKSYPQFSSDSKEVYFAQSNSNVKDDPEWHASYIRKVNIDTGEYEDIREDGGSPALSEDNRYLLYRRGVDYTAIYDFETGEKKIFDFTDTSVVPNSYISGSLGGIHPDNTNFLISLYSLDHVAQFNEMNDQKKVYKVDIETGAPELVPIPEGLNYLFPKYSPDATKILVSTQDFYPEPSETRDPDTRALYEEVFNEMSLLYLVRANVSKGEHGHMEPITSYEEYLKIRKEAIIWGEVEGFEELMHVESPHDSWPEILRFKLGVAIYDLLTGEFTQLDTADHYGAFYPCWSPDGTQICYVLQNENDDANALYVYDLATGMHKAVIPAYTFTDPTAVADLGEPAAFAITGNYPNPFNPTTTIEFSLEKAGDVSLDIYNVMGQKVRELVSEALTAGSHSVVWDGRDSNGVAVSSGVYISRLKMGEQVQTNQMMLVK